MCVSVRVQCECVGLCACLGYFHSHCENPAHLHLHFFYCDVTIIIADTSYSAHIKAIMQAIQSIKNLMSMENNICIMYKQAISILIIAMYKSDLDSLDDFICVLKDERN